MQWRRAFISRSFTVFVYKCRNFFRDIIFPSNQSTWTSLTHQQHDRRSKSTWARRSSASTRRRRRFTVKTLFCALSKDESRFWRSTTTMVKAHTTLTTSVFETFPSLKLGSSSCAHRSSSEIFCSRPPLTTRLKSFRWMRKRTNASNRLRLTMVTSTRLTSQKTTSQQEVMIIRAKSSLLKKTTSSTAFCTSQLQWLA